MDELEPKSEENIFLEQIYSGRKPFVSSSSGFGFFELKPDDPREPDLCRVDTADNAEPISGDDWSRIESRLIQDVKKGIQEIESLGEPQ
ncbi:hypothetical protein KJ713_00095, partial [Patescibacteria group bacterium]|nr:hypothetical protein [Patescibacteria group bacterium]